MKSKDKSEQRRRTRSKSPARRETAKSKSPSRSRSKSPARTPSSKSEKLTSKSETVVTSSEVKVRSSRKSESSTATKNASPRKTAQEQESVTKSGKKAKTESPSRQSSRLSVKLTQITPKESLLTEKGRSKLEGDISSAKSKKLHRANKIGKVIFVVFFTWLFMKLVTAASMWCNLTTCKLNQWPPVPHTVTAFIDLESLMIVPGWVVLQALLASIPVGYVTYGPVLADGRRLKYRSNGFIALVLTAVILASMYYMKLPVFDMVAQHFVQMGVVAMLTGILFGIISHVASRRLPPKLTSHRADTGWTLGDAIIGRYLNPRILNIDVKMLLLFNVAMLGHLTMCAITVIEAYQRDKLHVAMILLMSYTSIVILVTLALQSSMVHSMFVMHDGFGILMSVGMMSIPFLDTLLLRYLFHHPQDVCYPDLAASVILFLVGVFIFLRADYVKTKFRQKPHDPCFADYDIIPTISGKSLLASGLWGWCRHPNYFGWILIGLASCLTCGLTCPLTYLYFTWQLLMFAQRTHDDGQECERKHGSSAWTRYCQRVRSRLIPYIY